MVVLPGLWFLLLGYTLPRNKPTIFNRLTGVVQLPGAFWDKPVLTPFDELKAFFGPNGRSGIFWWTLKVERKTQSIKYFFPVCIDLWMEGSWQTWTYWVWYMDRNRPLPPGDALDDYRQMDYERRRAEGFPLLCTKAASLLPRPLPSNRPKGKNIGETRIICFMMKLPKGLQHHSFSNLSITVSLLKNGLIVITK
jgi:hypothetical protein